MDVLVKIVFIVSNFFDGFKSVLVMDIDLKIKWNCLNLLGLFCNNVRVLVDFG